MSGETATKFDRPLVAWLGDDFTGAAAVMEVLSFSGLPSILYLSSPDADTLRASEGCLGIGIATLARSQSPEWMEERLPPIYEFLDETGAEFVHYKICSTLDSSPAVGSIGKAIELGRDRFRGGTRACRNRGPRNAPVPGIWLALLLCRRRCLPPRPSSGNGTASSDANVRGRRSPSPVGADKDPDRMRRSGRFRLRTSQK